MRGIARSAVADLSGWRGTAAPDIHAGRLANRGQDPAALSQGSLVSTTSFENVDVIIDWRLWRVSGERSLRRKR
jgi:hypothetical protein